MTSAALFPISRAYKYIAILKCVTIMSYLVKGVKASSCFLHLRIFGGKFISPR